MFMFAQKYCKLQYHPCDGKKSVSAVALCSHVILIDLLFNILIMEGVCERQISKENMSIINSNTFVRNNIVIECADPQENKHL